jgi:hypothetical protein
MHIVRQKAMASSIGSFESRSPLEDPVEAAKFARLENLLIQRQEARVKMDRARKEAAQAAADAKQKSDEDKLAKLEKLILAQRDQQIRREETEKKRKGDEDKLSKPERFDLAQKDERPKREAAAETVRTLKITVADSNQRDGGKLAILEKLIIAQKDVHLKRELAAEAARVLEIAAADVET